MLACWQLSVISASGHPAWQRKGKTKSIGHSRSMLSAGSSCMAFRPKPRHSVNICLYFTLPEECLIWHCVPLQTFRWSHTLCHQSCVNHIRQDTQCMFVVAHILYTHTHFIIIIIFIFFGKY